jgi:hypothetical protein
MAQIVPSEQVGQDQVLFRLRGADMNVTTDQVFERLGVYPSYIITSIRCNNASISLSTAAGGIYSGAAKAGDAVVAAAQAYSALTGPTLGIDLTIAAVGRGVRTGAPILSLTTAQGAAATADFYVIGLALPA